MLTGLRDLYRYRSLLVNLVRKEQDLHHRNTLLGFAWSFLNPLLLMLVFVVVFGIVGKFALQIENYALFLLAGLLPWQFCAAGLVGAANSFRESPTLVLKIRFPRVIVPLAALTSQLITFGYSLLVLLPVLWLAGCGPSLPYLCLPLVILCQFALLAGAGVAVALISAFYRDVSYLVNVVLAIGFYATPVFYPIDMVPPGLRTLYYFNPLVHVITAYRRILLHGNPPGTLTLLALAGFALLALALGTLLYRRYQGRIAESL